MMHHCGDEGQKSMLQIDACVVYDANEFSSLYSDS